MFRKFAFVSVLLLIIISFIFPPWVHTYNGFIHFAGYYFWTSVPDTLGFTHDVSISYFALGLQVFVLSLILYLIKKV